MHVIQQKKKPQNGLIYVGDLEFNRDFSSDRSLVEKYSGRIFDLWSVLSHKWRWDEECFEGIFSL